METIWFFPTRLVPGTSSSPTRPRCPPDPSEYRSPACPPCPAFPRLAGGVFASFPRGTWSLGQNNHAGWKAGVDRFGVGPCLRLTHHLNTFFSLCD